MPHESNAACWKCLDANIHRLSSPSFGSEIDWLTLRNEMDAGGHAGGGERTFHGAVLRRGGAEGRRKGPSECLVCLVPSIERDASDWLVAVFELLCRALEPKPPDVLLYRFPDHSSKHSVEMEGREMGDPCQFFQRKGFIQVALDVNEYAQNAFAVVVFGLHEHRQALSVKPSASEDNLSRMTFDRLIVLANLQSSARIEPMINQQLRQQLAGMRPEGMRVRAELKAASELGGTSVPRMEVDDVENADRLRELIDWHGWPSDNTAGKDVGRPPG
jgi:hypothetical protein